MKIYMSIVDYIDIKWLDYNSDWKRDEKFMLQLTERNETLLQKLVMWYNFVLQRLLNFYSLAINHLITYDGNSIILDK